MATFAGFHSAGFIGSLLASFALILPMVIITSFVFKLYKKFQQNKYVKNIIYVLRPTGCALLCAVGVRLIYKLIILPKDFMALILIILLFILTFKCPRNPVIYMSFAALFAIIFKVLL